MLLLGAKGSSASGFVKLSTFHPPHKKAFERSPGSDPMPAVSILQGFAWVVE